MCLSVFQFQFEHNLVYQKFCKHLGINDALAINDIKQIPYLPIELFKTHEVKAFEGSPEKIFYSSATGQMGQSRHYVKDLNLYEKSFIQAFEHYFGSVQNTCFLGLLPSYLEREGSSLIYMVQKLMKRSGHPMNGFFLYEHDQLLAHISHLEQKGKPYFLFGVSFALLDFASKNKVQLKAGKIIETGGMKGRKKEITKAELYTELSEAFQTRQIFSEYGMTELMSQAYADIHGHYQSMPWMHVSCTDPNDPLTELPQGKTGAIRIIDLANLYSCAFIQSSDLGKTHPNQTFEILGRLDRSDLRGCSLLVS